MRLGNRDGRAVLLLEDTAVDVAEQSDGRFGPDLMDVYEKWEEFSAWAKAATPGAGRPVSAAQLGTPVPRPRQIFGIGLNYRDHADEANLAHPENIVVFTKFASSLAGPESTAAVSSDSVDYEAELVVVVGREAHRVGVDEAADVIAGYSVGQDISDRGVQMRPPAPQFSLGKSFPGYAPVGPAVVTRDELADPSALRISCAFTGPTAQAQGADVWTAQDGSTGDMIFSPERIISDLSQVVTLYPGDLIFTGTPAGVGMARGVAVQPGDVMTTTIEGIGSITTEFVDG